MPCTPACLPWRRSFDGPQSTDLKALIEKFWAAGKVVSAVCHGPAGLVSAVGADGKSIFNGRRVS